MTEQHLSLDDLADLLAAEGSKGAEAHVATCAGCAGRLDELAAAEVEVAAVLASLPAPPVPDGLDARLQAALDAEPALAPAAAGEGPVALGEGARVAAGGTVTPFPDAGARSRRPRRWLPAAAAACALVVVGGVLGTSLLLSDGRDGTSTTTAGDAGGGAGGADADPFGGLARSATGTDYAADGTLAAALPALVGGSATPFTAAQRSTSDADAAAEAAEGPDPVLESGQGTADPLQDTAVAPELERLRAPEGLASCLSALLPPDEPDLRPLAVDYAAYSGQPALVVVLPATGADEKVDVFVVGAGCTAGDDQTLFFTRLDRP